MSATLICCVFLGTVMAAGDFLNVHEMKVKVYCSDERLRSFAPEVLEFYEVTPEYVVCAVTAQLFQELLSAGYDIEVIVPDVRARAMLYDGFFHTYQQLRDTWAVIAQNHPNICVLDTMGISAGGNLLLVMKISDNPRVMEGEPRICFDFSIHGNENNGCEVAHYALLQLVSGYGIDPLITYLVNNREIWLAPMDNPDGLISRSRYNAHGVDCNRNYGYSWNGGGPSVFSEPEASCFYHLAEENPMSAWSQYHSGTRASMWPWFYTTFAPMDSVLYAFEMARYAQICGWSAFQISRGLYPGNGGSTDWYYGARGALGYAHEICDGQPSPPSEIDTINRMNWAAMKEQIQRVNRGVMGYVTDSVSGRPLYALVGVNPPDWFTFTDSTGYYHKNLQVGTYNLRAWANGYAPKTVPGVVVPVDSFVRVNIALARDTSAPVCALKAITCKIREEQANTNPTHAWFGLGRRDGRRFSLGRGGWVTYDMGRLTPIVNGPGADFYVVEDDADPEACSVFVSNDWNSGWRFVGFGAGTQGYDLSVVGLASARFVRIADDGVGGSGHYAGVDLDAIEAGVVNAPGLICEGKTIYDSPPGGNNDGKLDPGERAGLVLALKNVGRAGVCGVVGVLRTDDSYVSVFDSLGTFGDILPDSVRANIADRFRVGAAANTPREWNATLKLYLTGTDYSDSVTFTIVVGELRVVDPIPDGPRQPPLYWALDDIDTGYAQHPTYDWIEIRGRGTRLTLSDDQTVQVELPGGFGPWRFYGQSFTQISVCSNGWVAPGYATSTVYTPVTLPSGSVPTAVYLNWCDLYPPAGGGVWYYHDSAGHRFIVEYDSVRYYSGPIYDKFQLVIYDTAVRSPSGDNVFVQQIYRADGAWGAMGMQDPTRTIGIQYSGHRAAAPVAAGRAVKYTTDLTGMSEGDQMEVPPLGIAAVVERSVNRGQVATNVRAGGGSIVSMKVYDGSGRLLRTVLGSCNSAGLWRAVWDGDDVRGRKVPAGVYCIRVSSGNQTVSLKTVLLR
ncbi:MAG: M14 family zinc carboxypeptidase [candidate division WOR-3 bacterium]